MSSEKIPLNPPLQKGEKRDLEKSIFATIAYYDYFNYPLTAGEIYYYLIRLNSKSQALNPNQILNFNDQFSKIFCHSERNRSEVKNLVDFETVSLSNGILRFAQDDKERAQDNSKKPSFFEIIEILDTSETLKKFIGRKNGFYFLRGREGIIKQRIQKKKLTDQKFKKVKWILRFISYFPFVRLIMLSGSMGLGNPLKESDIDLLVVAKHGRIWTTRAILTFFTLLFGVYRHAGKTENRLCLNHYITDKSLNTNYGNLYEAEEYINLLLLMGDLSIYQEFFKKNAWIKDYTYFASGCLENNLRAIPLKGVSRKMKYFFEFLFVGLVGDFFEKYMKKFQIYFIEKNPLTKNFHARIRYDDNNLVFHPIPKAPEVIGKWEERMAEFIV